MAYQPKSYRKFVATAATATLVASAVTPAFAADFIDVSSNYKEAVDYLVEKEIAKGTSDTTFGTVNSITRGDAAVMIANALKLDTKGAEDAGFKDLNNRVAGAVNALYAAGIVSGKTSTEFKPQDNITRQEMAKIMTIAFKLEAGNLNNSFGDVNENWDAYVNALVANKITFGKTADIFAPYDNVTRGEFALFMHRISKINPDPIIVEEGYKLTIESKDASLSADGADNTVITAKIIDAKTGEVATDADDIVLSFDASYGSLANTRVTVKDGVATVLLTSEFSKKELTSVLTAKLVETAPDSEWADEIGQLIASQTVKFTPVAGGGVTDEVKITGAESNEADRVTVFFNENVTPAALLDPTSPLYNSLTISQDGAVRNIAGFLAVEGNAKAIEVVFEKNTVLRDNHEVDVAQRTADGGVVSTSFILTDARQPEATSVKQIAYNKVEVTFSEPIADVQADQVSIDGGQVKIAYVSNGEFNQATGDRRNKLVVTTEKFIPAGDHSIQLSGISDFAGLSDKANISTNQIFDFNVVGNNVVPAATVTAESPEQLRLQFNTFVEGFSEDTEVAFEWYNEETKEWEAPAVGEGSPFVKVPAWTVTEVEAGNEYVYELEEDWTQYFNTSASKDNYYNHKFRLVVEADAVTNPANDKKNAKQELSLNYSGSVLNTPDTSSPALVGQPVKITDKTDRYFNHYLVTFSEPVKDRGLDVDDTPSQLQGTTIPNVVVEFVGTDKDGKKVTVDGEVLSYYGSSDKEIVVSPDVDALQDLVDNSDYSESWELVVRNVSDDVGNAATTLTQDFSVPKSPAKDVFKVKDTAYDGVQFVLNGAAGSDDQIILDFTSAVKYTGNTENALNLSNYTLNGQPLPKGAVATLKDGDNNTKNGYERVVIELKNDYLDASTNVINISKDLKSANGLAITGLTEIAEAPVQSADNGGGTVDPDPEEGTKLSSLPANAYEIQDNTTTDTWGVVLTVANLPKELQGADSYTITVDGKEYTLTQNRFNAGVFSGQVSSVEHTKADVEAGIVEKVVEAEAPATTLSSLPAGSYEIQDNTTTDTWGVVLTHSKLPAAFQGGTSYTITVEGVDYELTKNRFNADVFSGQVSSVNHTQADVQAGTVTKN